MINIKLIVLIFLEVAILVFGLYLVSGEGAEMMRIRKQEPVCRVIGEDVASGRDIVSCFYGIRVDSSRIDVTGNEVTNVRILAFEELYFGGTWNTPSGYYVQGAEYNYDGEIIGKYRKDFKYNDNADVFWKVEVGLNGSTLEFCSMRDMEYSDTSRTKESCGSLNIDII